MNSKENAFKLAVSSKDFSENMRLITGWSNAIDAA
jgi:hypothetical protein